MAKLTHSVYNFIYTTISPVTNITESCSAVKIKTFKQQSYIRSTDKLDIMSLFNDLSMSQVQQPDVRMNQGPLPNVETTYATPDARFGSGSGLLQGISPYAYGEPDRLSTQTSYLNVPHRIQKIVPVLSVPDGSKVPNTHATISHAVADGDIAFILRSRENNKLISGEQVCRRAGMSHMLNGFINLATVNYLLAGMQNPETCNLPKWDSFLVGGLGFNHRAHGRQQDLLKRAMDFVRWYCTPFGIAHGSDKQGGMHETIFESSTAGVSNVNFVTSLLIDGNVKNLVNIWSDLEISSGDRLILTFKYCDCDHYVLNHYRKGATKVSFEKRFSAWQLVPDIYSMNIPVEVGNNGEQYDARQHGFWHIAQTQVMCPARDASILTSTRSVQQTLHRNNTFCKRDRALWQKDDMNMRGGNLLEATFVPVWESYGHGNHRPPVTGSMAFSNASRNRDIRKIVPLTTEVKDRNVDRPSFRLGVSPAEPIPETTQTTKTLPDCATESTSSVAVPLSTEKKNQKTKRKAASLTQEEIFKQKK